MNKLDMDALKKVVKRSKKVSFSLALMVAFLISGGVSYAGEKIGNATSTGQNSVAIGENSSSTGDSSVAIGENSDSSDLTSIALGNSATSSGESTIAIGNEANAKEEAAIAIGNGATADENSIAIGELANSFKRSTIIGLESKSTGGYSVGIGEGMTVGMYAVGVGYQGGAIGERSVSIGSNFLEETDGSHRNSSNLSNGVLSVAIGAGNHSDGTRSVTIGTHSNSKGNTSIALGTDTYSEGDNSIAIGTHTWSSGIGSIAIGGAYGLKTDNDKINYPPGEAIATAAVSSGNYSIAVGTGTVAHNQFSTAIGAFSETDEDNTVSFGNERTNRKLMHVAKGIADTDAVNVSQLKALAKGIDTNIDVQAWKEKLGVGAGGVVGVGGVDLSSLHIGEGTIDDAPTNKHTVTGAAVKTYITNQNFAAKGDLDKKLDKDGSNMDDSSQKSLSTKLSKGTDIATGSETLTSGKQVKEYVTREVDKAVIKGAKLDGDIKEGEVRGVTGDKIARKFAQEHREISKITGQVDVNTNNINYIYQQALANKQDIKSLNTRIDRLDSKINKVSALSQATANLDFGEVKIGNVAVGAGVSVYMANEAVAVGVAYRPDEDWFLSAKWAGVAGDPHYNSVGGSISYQFNLN